MHNKTSNLFKLGLVMMVLAVCMFTVMLTESRAQTIAVSPSSVTMGGSVTASWSGFSGNVNLGVYTGNGLLCYANTNFNPSVTLSQVLSTSGNCPAGVVWTARSDYRVGIELRTAPFTVTYSNYFSVTPAPPTLTSPTNNSSLPVGQNITFQWSNSSGSVSNSSIKVCTNSAMTQNCQVFESGLTQTIVSASMFTTGVTQYWQARSRTSTSEWGIYGPTPAWSFTLIAPIISPHVSVTPTSGPQGQLFSEPGTGFTPNGTATLYFSGPDGPSTFPNKAVLPNGTYQHSWTCNACPVGQYTYHALDVASGTYSNTVTFMVTVPGVAYFTPLYRLYKGGTVKDHFYTIDAAERDRAVNINGFAYERVEGFVSSVYFAGSVPLYRLYHSSNDVHFYTTSEADKNTKVAAGYTLENTYYIYPYSSLQPEWTVPLYYAYSATNSDNFYTTSKYEFDHAKATWGYTSTGAGIIGYVASKIANNRPQGDFSGVGMAIGNLSLPSFTDLSLAGFGPQLSFTRNYNSRSLESILGNGWSFNYDSYIIEGTDGSIHVTWGNGSESHFNSDFTPYPGYFEKIEREGTDVYKITTKDQTVYKFIRYAETTKTGPTIYLYSMTDKHNNSLTLDWVGDMGYMVLINAKDSTGRNFNFENSIISANGKSAYRITKVTDTSLSPNPNREILLDYNPQGNLWKVTDARGNITIYGYNPDGLLNSIAYPEGNTVTVTYNDFMQVTGYTNGTVSLAFDGYGTSNGTSVMDVTEGNSVIATYQHDGLYRAPTITYPADGTTVTSQFGSGNFVNLRDWIKDRLNQTTNYSYDANGNVTSVKNALNETTQFEYDEKNNLTAVVDPRNTAYRTVLTYDATKTFLESIRLPLGETTSFLPFENVNPKGLIKERTDPTGHKYVYTYDNHGNPTQIMDQALSTHVDLGPDGAGRVRWKTDPYTTLSPTLQRSVTTSYAYDENDNVASVQIGTNPASIYTFDRNNRMTHVTDPRGKVTHFAYNVMNLLESQTSPDAKSWSYIYNSFGKVQTVSRPDSTTVTYEYDTNRRLWRVRHNGTLMVEYTYDANGNIKTVSEASRTTTMNYDVVNRLSDVTDPFGNIVSYGYDAAGNRTRITYPVARNVIYAYDADNRLSTVTDWLSSGQTTYNYDAMGVLRSITNPNGTTRNFTYDNAYRLTGIANRFGSTPINSYTLTLNAVSIPLNIGRNEPLTLPVPPASDTGYTYNDANQIATAGSVSFTHDLLGNLNGANDGRSLTFDYANRLIQTVIGGDTRTNTYDAFGNRIARTVGGIQTRYLLDLNGGMSQVLAELESSNAVKNYYIYGDGSLLSRISSTGQRFTYHYDHLGSTTAVTDDSGTVAEQYGYDEFGRVLASGPANSDNPFRYVGQFGVMDEDNGLLHMRARYYDTGNGRFLSRDPLGFGGGDLNLYAYVRGNPVTGIDPLGLDGTANSTPEVNMEPWYAYGHFGGPGWTGGSSTKGSTGDMSIEPIDSMDALFWEHDKAYASGDSKIRHQADEKLYKSLKELETDPNEWDIKAPNANKAKEYRSEAIAAFNIKISDYHFQILKRYIVLLNTLLPSSRIITSKIPK
jgi:RHS repeat-associated protein